MIELLWEMGKACLHVPLKLNNHSVDVNLYVIAIRGDEIYCHSVVTNSRS